MLLFLHSYLVLQVLSAIPRSKGGVYSDLEAEFFSALSKFLMRMVFQKFCLFGALKCQAQQLLSLQV